MIHEIFPHSFNNKFIISKKIKDYDFVFYFHENSLLFKITGDSFEIPRKKDISGFSDTGKHTYLFSLDNIPCYLIWDNPKTDENAFVYKEINLFRTLSPKELAWTGMVASQLMNWYVQNRFCGKCGAKTIEKTDERALICPDCNNIVFPKISPAIIVTIICDNKILLASNVNFRQNWYSLIAGYADVGESLEETVIREVKEEVGIDVKNIRYYKSQPWPFSGSMMIGFFAEADCNQQIQIDNKEITHAAWYTRGNLPNHPTTFSIAGEMIEKFEKNEL